MRSFVSMMAALTVVACGVEEVTAPYVDITDEEVGEIAEEEPAETVPETIPEEEEAPAEVPEVPEVPSEEEPIEEPIEEPATPTPPSCVEYTMRHLQASMQHTDSVADRRAAIDLAFENADGVSSDTISWTEIETQMQIDRINARAGWATYWPHNPNNPTVHPANAIPISFKTSVFEFISGSSQRASDGRAGVSPHRYVNRVRLRHRASGTDVARVSHHSVSGVDNPQNNVDYRLDAHARNIAKFNDVMLGARFPVIGSGDFNTTRLRAKLRDENGGSQPFAFDVPDSGGSHGSRLIDYIVRRKSDGAVHRLDAVRFVSLGPSDHRGVRARFTYRPPPCL